MNQGSVDGTSENRGYLRIPFDNSLEFQVCSLQLISELHLASSRNISQTGMCFTTSSLPPAGSILKINADLETVAKCIQVENMLYELDGCILGKVVWTRPSFEDPSRMDVGVAFIKAGESNLAEVEEAVSLLK